MRCCSTGCASHVASRGRTAGWVVGVQPSQIVLPRSESGVVGRNEIRASGPPDGRCPPRPRLGSKQPPPHARAQYGEQGPLECVYPCHGMTLERAGPLDPTGEDAQRQPGNENRVQPKGISRQPSEPRRASGHADRLGGGVAATDMSRSVCRSIRSATRRSFCSQSRAAMVTHTASTSMLTLHMSAPPHC